MISPEFLRSYSFFSGLRPHHIASLVQVANSETMTPEKYFFHEGKALKHFYLVIEGIVAILIAIPTPREPGDPTTQLLGNYKTKNIALTTVGSGDIFGWSALIPPYTATASAKSITPCKVVSFDCEKLVPIFQADCQFGYLMTQKAAQVIRDRLQDLLVESLAFFTG